jgi:long-chain acyl-CoA synthetase
MHLTQVLERGLQLKAERSALICGERRVSWREFRARVARFAGALVALGLKPGDRVAMLADNGIPYVEFHYAVPWAGGVIVPLNSRLADVELIEILRDCGATVLVLGSEYASRKAALRDAAPDLQQVIELDAPGTPADYETLLARHDPIDDARRGGDDLYAIIYTGGTTGRPKGVALSQANLVANTLMTIALNEFTEDMVYLHNSPLFHSSGCARLVAAVTVLATNVILPRFEPLAVLRAIAGHRVTHVILVPTMLNRCLNCPEFATADLSSLTHCVYGASSMPEALLRRALAMMPGVQFAQSYGMTELSPAATFLPAKYHVLDGPNAGKLASIGYAIPTAEIRIADTEDCEAPRGQIGEIQVRGPMVMQGYWNQPELTARTLRGGWMHTGDAGYMDEDGFIYLVDRIKDMIVSGGENVYSAEVENALHEHPGVRECAVIGLPHPDLVEAVHAIVVPHPGAMVTADALIAHCRTLIAGYKCPRSVEIRSEPLPLSGTNKILKTRLRQEALVGLGAATTLQVD